MKCRKAQDPIKFMQNLLLRRVKNQGKIRNKVKNMKIIESRIEIWV